MTRKVDIGGYLRKLTQHGAGGRRSAVTARLRDAIEAGKHAAQRTRRPRSGRDRPARSTDDAVRIEYSPRLDGDADPGEVVWGWVPYEEDPTQGKDRPVVVIGRRGAGLVGVPLTTRADDREPQVPIGTGAWDPDRRDSYARVRRLVDLDPQRVRREGAVLDPDRFAVLVAAVDRHHDVELPN
jgi:hypothetical protein